VLGAYAVDASGVPTCNATQAVPFNLAPKPLGSYLKNDEIFYCPNNPISDKRTIVQAYYPRGHALYGQGTTPVRFGTGLPNAPQVCFYAYDSYSVGRVPRGNSFVYELRYTLFWSDQELNQQENQRSGTQYGQGYYDGDIGPKGSDNPRQLGYRAPDTTAVVTWCTYHRSYDGDIPQRAKNDIVLFLTGNVKVVDSRQMFESPYLMRP